MTKFKKGPKRERNYFLKEEPFNTNFEGDAQCGRTAAAAAAEAVATAEQNISTHM